MAEPNTVKEILDTTLSLMDDISQTLARLEEKNEVLGTSIATFQPKSGIPDSLTSDANELRNLLITLRQQLEKSITADLDPLHSTLKFLQAEVPILAERASELAISIQALTTTGIPQMKDTVNAVVANVSPIKVDTEIASNFAKNFNEPLMKMLGKRSDFQIQEGENILMNMALAIFELTGRDDIGRVPHEPNLKAPVALMKAMTASYFKKNYLDSCGQPLSAGAKLVESGIDYVVTNFRHRIFDAIVVGCLWAVAAGYIQKARDVQVDSSKQLLEYMSKTDQRLGPLLDKVAAESQEKSVSRPPKNR